MRDYVHHALIGWAALLGVQASGDALAQPVVTHTIVDTDLVERGVQLIGIGRAGIRFVEDGETRTLDTGELVAVLPGESLGTGVGITRRWWPPSAMLSGYPAVVDLVDGQRLIGYVAPAVTSEGTPEPEAIDIAYRGVPSFRVPFERIARVNLNPASLEDPWDRSATDDTLVMRNGDRVSGFLLSISDDVTLEAGSGREVSLSVQSVSQIVFANPTEQSEAPLYWLADGSVLAGRPVGNDKTLGVVLRPVLEMTSSGSSIGVSEALHLDPDEVLGVAERPGTIGMLSAQEMVEQTPLGGRRWAPPVSARVLTGEPKPLGADVVLPGPMRAAWVLPAGATRFACGIELGEGSRAHAGAWSDCAVRVGVARGQGAPEFLAEHRLDGTNLGARVVLDLDGVDATRLVIEVDAGAYGPVQNSVTLRRPVILLAQ